MSMTFENTTTKSVDVNGLCPRSVSGQRYALVCGLPASRLSSRRHSYAPLASSSLAPTWRSYPWSRALGVGAGGVGVLLACHGGGAVLGALLLPYARERASADQLVLGGGILAAGMTGMLATAHHVAVAAPILLVTGAGSLAILSTLMMSAQVALPPWVKARGLAVVQMVFSGALTNYGPSDHWPAPVVAGTVAGDRGPVMITIEYRIDPAQGAAFAVVLERMGHVRRRDGALFWEHFADTADPTRHVEVFIAESWLEHLRQHERITVADPALEDELTSYHVGDTAPVVTHLISARTRR
jgi:Transmembrane secretion effector